MYLGAAMPKTRSTVSTTIQAPADAEAWQRLTQARAALELADTPIEAVKVANGAEVAKEWTRRAGASVEAQREWSVFAIEAQRKAGKLLRDMEKAPDGRPRKGESGSPLTPSIHDVVGAKTKDASRKRYDRMVGLAEVPDAAVTDYLARADEPTASRLLRIGRDAAAAAERERITAEAPTDIPDVDLRTGDFREVLADLRDVDAIITDPPYPKEFLPLLGDLAEWADEALTDDGVLAVMFGLTHLPEVYRLLSGGRPYRWTMAYLTPGSGYPSMARRLQSNWKPVLVYGGGPRFADVIKSDANDKQHHHWGQDYGGFAALVERLTTPGAHVADPFLGGGTTAVACRNTGRRFTGCDIDPTAVDSALRRLS
jgi:hypothetical protein